MNRFVEDEISFWERFYKKPLLRHDTEQLPEKGVFTYIVSRGETLTGVAEKFYADPQQARLIAGWNGFKPGAHLHTGQELKLVIPRLGLWTTLEVMKKQGDGCMLEPAASDRRFRSDELFRLRLSSSANGWLYIFNRDEGGRWRRLHPVVSAAGGVVRFSEYVVPNDRGRIAWFQLDHDKGNEELVLLFAIDEIEELADVVDMRAGDELKDSQETLLEQLFERKEQAAKGIIRTEGDSAKREAGAIIALGPDSGEPILIHRMRLQRQA